VIVRERLDLKRLNAQIEQLSAEVADVEKVRTRCGELEGQIAYLDSLGRGGSVPIIDILRDLTDIIPQSAWVNRFSVSDMDVKIEGYADSASELITRLEGFSTFSDVAFLSTITKTKDGKERFRIGLKARRSKS
jgi:general secretion pathway protein L